MALVDYHDGPATLGTCDVKDLCFFVAACLLYTLFVNVLDGWSVLPPTVAILYCILYHLPLFLWCCILLFNGWHISCKFKTTVMAFSLDFSLRLKFTFIPPHCFVWCRFSRQVMILPLARWHGHLDLGWFALFYSSLAFWGLIKTYSVSSMLMKSSILYINSCSIERVLLANLTINGLLIDSLSKSAANVICSFGSFIISRSLINWSR